MTSHEEFLSLWYFFRYKTLYRDPTDFNSEQTTVEKYFLERHHSHTTANLLRANFCSEYSINPLAQQLTTDQISAHGSFLLFYTSRNDTPGFEEDPFYSNRSLVDYLNFGIDEKIREEQEQERERSAGLRDTTNYFVEQGLEYLLHDETRRSLEQQQQQQQQVPTSSPSNNNNINNTSEEVQQQQVNLVTSRAISTGPLEKVTASRDSSPEPTVPRVKKQAQVIVISPSEQNQVSQQQVYQQQQQVHQQQQQRVKMSQVSLANPYRLEASDGNTLDHRAIDQAARRYPAGTVMSVVWIHNNKRLEWTGNLAFDDSNDVTAVLAKWFPMNPDYNEVFPQHPPDVLMVVPFPVANVDYRVVQFYGSAAHSQVSDLAYASNPQVARAGSRPPRNTGSRPNSGSSNGGNNTASPAAVSSMSNIAKSIGAISQNLRASSSVSRNNNNNDDDEEANPVQQAPQQQQTPFQMVPIQQRGATTSTTAAAAARPNINLPLLGAPRSALRPEEIQAWGYIARQNSWSKGEIHQQIDLMMLDWGVPSTFGMNMVDFQTHRTSLANSISAIANSDQPLNFLHPTIADSCSNMLLATVNMSFMVEAWKAKKAGKVLDKNLYFEQFSHQRTSFLSLAATNATVVPRANNNNNNFGRYNNNNNNNNSRSNRGASSKRSASAKRPPGCPLNKCWQCFTQHNGDLSKVKDYTKAKGCDIHGKPSGNASATGRH
jgi:hypothetical protein